ncbi:hypothetical protein J6590_077837 [Homalodisca vitripennis]|nr:hypothetical protein J6590_077837 [Homalodisca vitripennis]
MFYDSRQISCCLAPNGDVILSLPPSLPLLITCAPGAGLGSQEFVCLVESLLLFQAHRPAMEENIAKIINDSYFTGEITDDLREVCEDYFANPVSSSSDSELEDHESQEDATELNRSSEDVEYLVPKPVLQEELVTVFDAEIRSIKVEGCCRRKCSDSFTLDELLKSFLDSSSLDYYNEGTNQLDLVVLGQIRAMCRQSNEVKTGSGSKEKVRQRLRMIYTLSGQTVCERLFLAANAIKIKRFKRLLKHFKVHGMEPPVHKNFKRTPKNTHTKEDTENVVLFIRNYAEESALFMPGRLANHKTIVKLLPSSD